MELTAGLVDVPALEAAVKAEWQGVRSLMPPSPIFPLLAAQPGDVAQWAMRHFVGSFRPVPQQIVTVRKHRHSVRPVAELFLRDQLLYRVLTAALDADLATPSRQTQSFDDFQRAPLTDTTASHIVSSDVSSFYQYVDHNVLGQELLVRTGDADRVSALLDLLEGVTGRTYGLPQQSEPSDVLAETYIDIVHRRLARSGLRVWRYNDDWRIAAASWSEALHAVDLLEHECRRVGLTLNDSKTVIRTRETYEDDLDHREKVLKEIADEAELDLTDFQVVGMYEAIFIEPEQAAVQLQASRKILIRYGEHREDDAKDPKVLQTLLQLVPGALLSLSESVTAKGADVDPETLELCMKMLRTEQNLTPQVSRYLSAAITADEKTVLAAFDDLLGKNPYITPWQASWLGPHLGRAPKLAKGTAGKVRGAWLTSAWSDPATTEPVKSGLAITLARHKLISKNDLLTTYDSLSETGRPGIAAALGIVEPDKTDKAVSALCREDDLSEMAFDWGAALAGDLRVTTLVNMANLLSIPLASMFTEPAPSPDPETISGVNDVGLPDEADEAGSDAEQLVAAIYDTGRTTPTLASDIANAFGWTTDRTYTAATEATRRLAPAGLQVTTSHGELFVTPVRDHRNTTQALTERKTYERGLTYTHYKAVHQILTNQQVTVNGSQRQRLRTLGGLVNLGILDDTRNRALTTAATEAFIEQPTH